MKLWLKGGSSSIEIVALPVVIGSRGVLSRLLRTILRLGIGSDEGGGSRPDREHTVLPVETHGHSNLFSLAAECFMDAILSFFGDVSEVGTEAKSCKNND